MNIIYDNTDILIKLDYKGYKINYNLVQSINYVFYTSNVHVGITKTMSDVDINNSIKLDNSELILLESGMLKYYYIITNIDGSVNHNTVVTDYYICHSSTLHPTYYTQSEVDSKLASKSNIGHTHPEYLTEHQDLSSYALKSEIPTDYLTEVPSEYITESELESKGYITIEDIPSDIDTSNFYTKSEIDSKGYITSIPSEYITETELNAKGYLTEHQDLSGYSKTGHTHSQYLTEHQDLSSYAKLTDIPTDYITEIPSEYVTETELTAKGYLTEHQSLENYYNKSQIDALLGDTTTIITDINNMVV